MILSVGGNSLEKSFSEEPLSWRHSLRGVDHHCRRLPEIEQLPQSSTEQNVSRLALPSTGPHAPVQEAVWGLEHRVTEAAWMEIECKHPGEAFVSHAETSLKFGISRSRWETHWNFFKVDVLADAIAAIGLTRSVVALRHYVDEPECRDPLRSCDVIFGCTDDHLGRNLLNRLAHFYLIPVIDIGVLIEPNDKGGYDTFDGRVTVVQPGYPCQVCRQLISPQLMLEEGMRRRDPQLYEQYRRAGYIVGGTDPNPVVVTFTTEMATVAVNELLHRLTGFRGSKGFCAEHIRRFDEVKDADVVAGGKRVPDCPLCGLRRYDGRGDMAPFLNQS